MSKEIKSCHWTELRYGAHVYNLHPDMINKPDGYKMQIMGRVNGMSFRNEKIPLEVTFDESFVIYWLKNKVLAPLSSLPIDRVKELLLQASVTLAEERANDK
jgi:hypothetical protein